MPRQIKQDIIIRAVDNTTRGFRAVEQKMGRMERFIRRVQTTLLGFVGINIAVNLVRDITAISDVAVELDAKLALVTQTTEELTTAQEALNKVSLESGSSLEANTILFTRMARPVRALGFELQDTLEVTKLVAQGLRISGASQQESASVIRQLSQAFQSGVLRGEEFNALMENGGRIAIALADGLGVTTGELRKMSKAGELSTESVIIALKKQSAAIERENAKLPLTIGRALENIRTKFLNFSRQNKEVNKTIADGINAIATNIDAILKVSAVALTILMGKVIQAIIAARIERHKAAVAAKKEAIDAEVRGAKRLARIANETKLRAIATAAKTKEAVAVANAELRLHMIESERLATSIVLNKSELANATTKRQKIALNTAIIAQQRELVITEAALAKATDVHTAALAKNAIASTAAAKAQGALGGAGVVANLRGISGLFSKMTGFVSKLGLALLGLPGLIALAGITIAGMYIEWEVAWEALLTGLRKIVAVTKLAILNLAKPWNIVDNIAQFKKELASADDKFSEFTDNYLSDQNAQTAGYKNAADQRAKVRQQELQDENRRQSAIRKNTEEIAELREKDAERAIEAQEELSAHADATLVARQAVIDAELEMERDRITTLQLGDEDYAEAITQIEAEASAKHTELLLSSIAEDEARWGEFYSQREANAVEHADSELQIEINAIDAKLAKELESFETSAKGRNDHTVYINNLEKNAAKARGDVIADALLARGEAFRESRLEELVKQREFNVKKADALRGSLDKLRSLRKGYLDSVSEGEQTIRDLERRSAEFLRELNADNTTSAGKAALAQTKLADVQAELRRISQLDQVKDAKQINDIRTNALTDLESLATAEKSRGESLKAGSLEAIAANNNQRQAAELYKDVVADTIKLEKQGIDTNTERARVVEEDIQRRVESLKKYEAAIEEGDKLIAVQRQIVIDVESDQALAEIDKIQVKLDKLKNKTVVVTTVHKTITERAGGGFGGEDVRLATGGYPRRQNYVPGSGDGDKVKALLEPQEFIVKKSSSRILGAGVLNLANQNPEALLDMLEQPIKRRSGGFGSRTERDPSRDIQRLISSWQFKKDSLQTGKRVARSATTGDPNLATSIALERAKALEGVDYDTFSQGRDLIDQVFELYARGQGQPTTSAYLRHQSKLGKVNAEWTALLKNAGEKSVDLYAGATESVDRSGSVAETFASSDEKGDTTSERTSLFSGGAASSTAKIVEDVKTAVTGAVQSASKAIGAAVIPATAFAGSSGSIIKSELTKPKVNATSPTGLQTSEKIEVLLKTNDGSSATGVFDSDDATRQLLNSLRDNGQVIP